MKVLGLLKPWIVLPACFAVCGASLGQEPGCLEIARMAAMARAKSPARLKACKEKAGNGYRAQLIFAARMVEIDPGNKAAAESLLDLLPKDDEDPAQAAWLDLTQLEQCASGNISSADEVSLDTLQYHLPRLAAAAVLLVPEKMFDYVSYTLFSLNPESDYAVRMRKVCRTRHKEFTDAVNRLSPKDRAWFVTEAFNPNGCRTIFHPEQ